MVVFLALVMAGERGLDEWLEGPVVGVWVVAAYGGRPCRDSRARRTGEIGDSR